MPSPTENNNSVVTPNKNACRPDASPNDAVIPVNDTTTAPLPPTNNKFTDREVSTIARIVWNEDPATAAMATELQGIFTVMQLSKLSDFEGQDATELIGFAGIPRPGGTIGPIQSKRLKDFFDYATAPSASLPPDLTYTKIRTVLEARAKELEVAVLGSMTGDGTSVAPTGSDFKFKAPVCDLFTGEPEEFWGWWDSVLLEFGQSGISEALTDPEYHNKSDSAAKASSAGWYAIAKSLQCGHANWMSGEVSRHTNRKVAHDFYTKLMKTFNTEENQAHFMVHAIDSLNEIKLDHTKQVHEFINDWKQIINRLNENKNQLATNREILRVFLLRALQSDAFEESRQFILRNPLKTIDDYLDHIRNRADSMRMLSGDPPIRDYGDIVPGIIRRAESRTKTKGSEPPKWHIPFFPNGWKQALGRGAFRRLEEWRRAAHGTNKRPRDLEREFDMKKVRNKSYDPNLDRKTKKARRGAIDTEEDDNSQDGTTDSRSHKFRIHADVHQRKKRVLRRTTSPPEPNEPVLITDSGADQFFAGYIWRRLSTTGRLVELMGALAGRHSGTVLPVASVVGKLIDAAGNEWCAVANEVLHDTSPNQHESLLPPAQVRNAGNAVDDCPSDAKTTCGDFGTQCCVFGSGKAKHTLPLFFDGLKCYYRMEAITDDELTSLPRIVLTGDAEYEPTSRTTIRRMNTDEIDWKRTMAFPPDDVLKHTLEATTQLIPVVEAESPQQNLAELRGGRLKHVVQHILLLTGAPAEYWCYCLEYVAFVKARTSKRVLNNRTSWEAEFGAVPDISKCRFSFWQPVWFYTPHGAFPRQRMMKARFLGFSPDSGDAFTYVIVTEPDDEKAHRQFFTRSVIRPRYPREDAPFVFKQGKSLEIFKRDERTILTAVSDSDFPPALSDRAHNPLPTIQEEPQPLDSVEEYERGIEEVYGPPASKRLRTDPTSDEVLLRTDQEELQPLSAQDPLRTPSVPTAEVELPTELHPQDQEMLVANSTATVDATPEGPRLPQTGPVPVTQEEPTNSFMTEQGESASISPDGDEDSVHSADEALDDHQVSPESLDVHLRNLAGLTEDEDLFDSICGHEFRDGVLFLQILWKTDETSWEKYRACREDFPYDVAKYICSKKIGSASGNHSNGPHQRWARTFLKKTRRVMRRFVRYHGYSKPMLNIHDFRCPREDNSDQIQLTKMHKKSQPRQVRRAKKKGRLRRPLPIRFGIPIPRTVNEALALDDDNGNHFWREAMEKEIASLC